MKENSLESRLDHQILEYFLQDGTNRAIVMNSETLKSIIQMTKGAFKHTQLGEKLMSDHVVYWFSKNNFMFEPFNRKITQLVESGLATKYVKDFSKQQQRVLERRTDFFSLDQFICCSRILLLFMLSSALSYFGEMLINVW